MKIVSVRLTKGRLAALVVAAGVLLLGLLLLLPDSPSGPPGADEGQREQYLRSLGLDPEPGSEARDPVVIPAEFSPVYQQYNALQRACGFDLLPHRGAEVLRCTWRLRGTAEPTLAELLVRYGAVIGGSIYTARREGAMWGLTENICGNLPPDGVE